MVESNSSGQIALSKSSATMPTGDYLVERKLASTAWSQVFQARQRNKNRKIALKIINLDFAADPGTMLRFRQEAEAAKKLKHSHILRVLDYGFTPKGQPFTASELSEGKNLQQLLAGHKMAPLVCARLMMQLTDALAYAHKAGVVHGNVKPGNIVIAGRHSDEYRAFLVDTGITKTVASKHDLAVVGRTKMIVTPAYSSPEQYLGEEPGVKSDIYSLGCVMYEMLSGKPANNGINAIQYMNWHLHHQMPPLAVNNKDIAQLEIIIKRMTARMPENRYESMESVREDLQRFLKNEPLQEQTEPVSSERSDLQILSLSVIMFLIALACLYQVYLWCFFSGV